MSCANRDAAAIQDGADIVRVHIREVEAHDAATGLEVTRSEYRDIANFVQNIEEVAGEGQLVRVNPVEADAVEIIARGGEADRAGDVRRARLEFMRARCSTCSAPA